jgi:predicted lactoylglutathione lyase
VGVLLYGYVRHAFGLDEPLLNEKRELKMKRLFVNLPVNDLEKSKSFFTGLGYTFNPKFTNDKGAAMVISDANFVMLLQKDFFNTFIKKEIADARRTAEVIVSHELETPAAVDELVNKALAAGASETISMNDPGMYLRVYMDLDGHLWEIFFMDEDAMQPASSN